MAAHYLAFRRRRSFCSWTSNTKYASTSCRGFAPWLLTAARTSRASRPSSRCSGSANWLSTDFRQRSSRNPLIRELDALARESRLNVPFVEELAADIFMGTFSAKFLAAAQLAGQLLRGSLYERYYDIDYEQLRLMAPDRPQKGSNARTSSTFAALCHSRSEAPSGWSVAANGMVIEQAQILTTHNLASLAGPIGLRHHFERKSDTLAAPASSRSRACRQDQGESAPTRCCQGRCIRMAPDDLLPLLRATLRLPRFLDQFTSRLAAQPSHVSEKLACVGGLDWVMRGGSLTTRARRGMLDDSSAGLRAVTGCLLAVAWIFRRTK